MNYSEAVLLAEEYGKEYFSDCRHPIYRGVVHITHEEGTYLFFNHAGVAILDDEWFAIYTEHHGTHVYAHDETTWIQYGEKNKIPFELKGFEE